MKAMEEMVAPSPQAITAWKNKADKLVALDSEITALQLKLEAKLKPVREQFEPDINARKAEAAKLRNEIVEFGTAHADILFAEGSVVSTKSSVITGRLTPASVTLEEGYEEKDVIEVLKTDRTLKQYLDCKWSLAKAAIKKVLANGGPHSEALGLAGIALAEGFSVSVKSKGD